MAHNAQLQEITAHLVAAADAPPDRAAVNAVLAAFSDLYNLDAIALDEDGAASLTIGREPDRIVVTLLHRPGAAGVMLGADMAEGTADDPECRRLALRANGTPDATGGGVFGVAPDGTRLNFLTQVLITGLDPESFGAVLMDFAELTADWRARFDLVRDVTKDTRSEAAA